MNQKKEEELKQSSLKLSIAEGAADRAYLSLGSSFITNFALALKANSFFIGMLSSVSALLPQLIQPKSNSLMERQSRKKIMFKFTLIEGLLWIPLAVLSFLYWKGIVGSSALILLLILYSLITVMRGVYHPAWFSWMGDLVPEKTRGKFFSKRNLVLGIVEIVTLLAGIFVIKMFEDRGYILLGLSFFFIIATVFKIISTFIIIRQYEPKFRLTKKLNFHFMNLRKIIPSLVNSLFIKGYFILHL